MNKEELIRNLQNQYKRFALDLEILNEGEFNQAAVGKWTAGQQLDHLCRALWPLVWGLKLPKFVIRMLFAKANRPSKTYEDLVAKYLHKIEEGAKASGPYIPKAVPFSKKRLLLTKMEKYIQSISKSVDRFSEKDLDRIVLPHPLLAKVTLREMLYFTAYHAEHHRESVEKSLS